MDLEACIKKIFHENNNKVQYKVLAEHFQNEFLEDDDFKVKFKKMVGKLATLKEENDDKYLILKSKYQRKGSEPTLAKNFRPDGLKSSVLEALMGGNVTEEDNLSLGDLDKLEFFNGTDLQTISGQPNIDSGQPDKSYGQSDLSSEQPDLSSGQHDLTSRQPDLGSDLTDSFNISSDSDSMKKLLRPLNISFDLVSNSKDSSPDLLDLPSDHVSGPHLSHSEPDLKSCDGKVRITVNNFDQNEAQNNLQADLADPSTTPIINPVQKSGSDPNMAVGSVKNRLKIYSNGADAKENGLKIKSNKFRQSHKDDSASPENCSVASFSLSDVERNWLLNAVKCDYQNLAKSLSINPDLANYADFTCGYTALHWAAKFGNLDAIKLLAGAFKADVDRKSGYTPLHLAAMHGQYAAMDLLIKTYGANLNIRDNSGRRAEHYVNNVYGTKRVKLADLSAHKSMSNSVTSARSRKIVVPLFYPHYPLTSFVGALGDEADGSSMDELSLAGLDMTGNASWTYGMGSFLREHNRSTENSLKKNQTTWSIFAVPSPLRNSVRQASKAAWSGAKKEIRRVMSSRTPPTSRPISSIDTKSLAGDDRSSMTSSTFFIDHLD